ncbi:MAG: DUF3789 domain-containing protein [Bacillota bacterium]|nr:DUF3789 domain-containing protein [Bacillota bacterium]
MVPGLIIGAFLGCTFGVGIMCLVQVNRDEK